MTVTRLLFLNEGIPAVRLPQEVLLHIHAHHQKDIAESMTAYEALSRLNEHFETKKGNCRLPLIEYGERGKPYFPKKPNLTFSIAHTRGKVAVAMSDTEIVGIDIERIDAGRLPSHKKIAESRFFGEERRILLSERLSSHEQVRCFYWIWTRKEAVAKALNCPILDVNTCRLSADVKLLSVPVDDLYIASLCQIKQA